MANVVLQGLALIPAELAPPRAPRALVTQGEDVVAEGWDGEPGTLIRQLRGGANHREGSLGEEKRDLWEICLPHVYIIIYIISLLKYGA